MESKLKITANLDDHYTGLKGQFSHDGFCGYGEGWYNNSEINNFCSKLSTLCKTMEGAAELIGSQRKSDGSEYLELFSIRVYPLSQSKLNGIVGIHVTLSEYPYTDCRPEEIMKVSGEFQTRNQHIEKFAKELKLLISGSVREVCLYGGVDRI